MGRPPFGAWASTVMSAGTIRSGSLVGAGDDVPAGSRESHQCERRDYRGATHPPIVLCARQTNLD